MGSKIVLNLCPECRICYHVSNYASEHQQSVSPRAGKTSVVTTNGTSPCNFCQHPSYLLILSHTKCQYVAIQGLKMFQKSSSSTLAVSFLVGSLVAANARAHWMDVNRFRMSLCVHGAKHYLAPLKNIQHNCSSSSLKFVSTIMYHRMYILL